MQPVKVFFVVSSLEIGGIETYLLRFLSWAGHRLDATVVCRKKFGALEHAYRGTGATLVLCPLPPRPSWNYLGFCSLMRRSKPDVVCDFTGSFGAWVLLSAKFCGVKRRVAFYRGSGIGYLIVTKPKLMYAKLLAIITRHAASEVLSNSKRALSNFHPDWQSKLLKYEVIRNPVVERSPRRNLTEVRRTIGIDPNAFVVLHIGRATPEKNHRLLIDLAKRLECVEEVVFLAVGPGVPALVAECTQDLGNFVALDARSDVNEILGCANLFIFPSVTEGMPNALIEAMAAELPVLCSDIPEIVEVLPEGYEWVYDVTDVDGFKRAILHFAGGASRDVGAALRTHVLASYNSDTWFSAFLNVIRKGLPKEGRGNEASPRT